MHNKERETGLEPATACLGSKNSTAELHPHANAEFGVGNVELNPLVLHSAFRTRNSAFSESVGGEGFEPPKGQARQIYSLVQ